MFDLIHEAQMIGSRISLSVSRGHTLCLDRKSLYLKIPCRVAPAATESETVFLLLEVHTALAVCKLPILILFCGI